MKGIILAGGSGTRLHPMTLAVSKQLLPVYDKPMIYYPLSVLMGLEIDEILIISTPSDIPLFQKLLGDGKKWGISLSYAVQEAPRGIAEAFIIGEDFIGDDAVTLILGDNIFYGEGFTLKARQWANSHGWLKSEPSYVGRRAILFACEVKDPERYGVLHVDELCGKLSIDEKPEKPSSNWAVTGLYMYDASVCRIARSLRPSERGELEITTINNMYLGTGDAVVEYLPRGTAWLDTGTPSSMMEAAAYVEAIDHRQNFKIGCPEEVAWQQAFITDEAFLELSRSYGNSDYGRYLKGLLPEPPGRWTFGPAS